MHGYAPSDTPATTQQTAPSLSLKKCDCSVLPATSTTNISAIFERQSRFRSTPLQGSRNFFFESVSSPALKPSWQRKTIGDP